MTFRGLAALAVLGLALVLAACGGGSGRRGTDVAVTGTGPTSQVTGGQTIIFQMVVSNPGESDVADVRINDVVGNQLALLGITCTSAGGAVCPAALGVSMVAPSMPRGSSLTFAVTVQLAPNATGTIGNSMSAQVDGDVDQTNNQFNVSATAYTLTSNLVVGGSGPAGTVTGGDSIAYQMTVTNAGPDAASNVHFSNSVGNGLSNAVVSCAAGGGAVCPPSLGAQMDLQSMPAGGTLTFTVAATVNARFNGTATNRMLVSADTDSVRGDNDFTASATVVTPQAGIVVTVASAPANVPAGTTAAFVMTVANPTGPDPAASVHLVDTVGGNLTLTGVSCSAAGGAVCPASPGAVMDITNLPVGGTLTFTVNTTVAAGTQGSIFNKLDATVTSGAPASASAVAEGSAYANNVSVDVTPPSGTLVGGDTAHFTATVSNSGPGSALNAGVSSVLSGGVGGDVVVTCVQAQSTGTCPPSASAAMTIASMPAGVSLVFDIAAPVATGTNGAIAATVTATAAGDARSGDNTDSASVNATSPDLVATQSVESSTVAAGASAVFTAVVSNPSQSAASNLVITSGFSANGWQVDSTNLTVVCSASSGAACPDVATSSPWTAASLPAGRSLTFTFTLKVPAAARGDVTSNFSVSSSGDPNPSNNQPGPVKTTAVDGRNGTYKVFTGDGRTTSMAIDFDAGSYTMSGGSATLFSASGGEYVISGARRLRVASDLVVGSHDFGGGAVPYLAARSFGTSIADAQTQFNLATLDRPAAGGAAVTRPGSAAVASDGTLYLCQMANGTPRSTSNCAGGLATYSLSVDANGLYTATPITGTTASYQFYVARSGLSKVLISAGDAVDSSNVAVKRWRVGLQDPPALAGGILNGPSTAGEWVTMTLTSTSYSVVGTTNTGTLSATLNTIGSSGSTALLSGVRSDGPGIYVMQAGPLAVAFGVFGEAASGLLQIVVP
jgi:uncharacterized repeat protein (TIGR01451 family)